MMKKKTEKEEEHEEEKRKKPFIFKGERTEHIHPFNSQHSLPLKHPVLINNVTGMRKISNDRTFTMKKKKKKKNAIFLNNNQMYP